MKALFEDIREAVVGRGFLARFKDRTFGSVVGYLAVLMALQTVLLFAILAIHAVPALIAFAERDILSEHYPHGLEVTIENGEVTTNVEEPFFSDFGVEQDPEKPENFDHFLVIDTAVEDPYTAVREYNTAILLARSELAFQKDDREVRIIDLSEVDGLHITKETAHTFMQALPPFLYIGGAFALILGFGLVVVFSLIYYLALLLLFALYTWLAASLLKIPLRYGQAYALSAYALTLPILVDIVLDFITIEGRFLLTLGLFVVAVTVHLYLGRKTDAV